MSLRGCIGPCILLLAASPALADLEAGVDAVARRDFAAAFNEFKLLAVDGDIVAQVNLGNLYMKGLGVKQNYGEAARWYRNAAEKDEPMAQSKLGILYYYGLGVPQDYAEAGRWFTKAAEHGDRSAQAVLASLYALGEGLPRDYVKAYYWYTRAAEQGNEDAVAGRSSLVDEMTPAQMDEALRLLSEVRKREALKEEQALERIGSGRPADAERQAESGGKVGPKRRVAKQKARPTGPHKKKIANH